MRRLSLLLLCLLAFSLSASATTWYVRADGGHPANAQTGAPATCDGTHDAAFPASGTTNVLGVVSNGVNQPCGFAEWRDLYDNHSVNHLQWVVAGGDTIIIDNVGFFRVGIDNGTPLQTPSVWCRGSSDGPQGCFNPTIPAGTPLQHTRILGRNYASCSGLDHKVDKTKVSSLQGGWTVSEELNLTDTQYVDVECLELASVPHTCTDHMDATTGAPFCRHDQTAPPIDDYSVYGLTTSHLTSYAKLKNLSIHGHVNSGTRGPIGTRVSIDASDISVNGGAGINMDFGFGEPNGPDASLELSYTNVFFSGCNEDANRNVENCYGQETGGYGDSFGTLADSQLDLFIDHVDIRYSTQDGPDTVHTNVGKGFYSVSNSRFEGNSGAALKWGGGFFKQWMRNNLLLANCDRLLEPFPGFPANYNSQFHVGEGCRAYNGLGGGISQGGQQIFANNTYMGVAPTTADPGCSTDSCTRAVMTWRKNIFVGYDDPSRYDYGGQDGGTGMYCGPPCDNSQVYLGRWLRDSNVYWGQRSSPANVASGSAQNETDTNEHFEDPHFINEPTGRASGYTAAQFDGYTPVLPAGSPYAGWGYQTPSTDTTLVAIHSIPDGSLNLNVGGPDRKVKLAKELADLSLHPLDDATCTSGDTSKVAIIGYCTIHAVAVTATPVVVTISYGSATPIQIAVKVEGAALLNTTFTGTALGAGWTVDQGSFAVDTGGAFNTSTTAPYKQSAARYTGMTFPSDYVVCVTQSPENYTTTAMGPSAAASASNPGYHLANALYSNTLFKGASSSTLGTKMGGGDFAAPGGQSCLRKVANHYTEFLDGSQTSETFIDNDHTGGGPGIWAWTNAGDPTSNGRATNYAVYPVSATPAPLFTTQPQSQTVAAPGMVTFSAVASDADSYQWYVIPSGGPASPISGATATSYTTPATTLSSSGSAYYVVATGLGGNTTSAQATLTVTASAPAFAQPPANVAIDERESAVFHAQVTGYPVPTCAWKKNGTAISGATDCATLTYSAALAESGSSITLTATNSQGTATSAAAMLTVNAFAVANGSLTGWSNDSVPSGYRIVAPGFYADGATVTFHTGFGMIVDTAGSYTSGVGQKRCLSYSQAPAGAEIVAPVVNGVGTDAASSGGYAFYNRDGSYRIGKVHAGVADIASVTGTQTAANVLCIKSKAGVITGYVDGALVLSTTDTTYTAGYPGMMGADYGGTLAHIAGFSTGPTAVAPGPAASCAFTGTYQLTGTYRLCP